MRFDRDLAFILLAVYLILVGLMGLGVSLGALSIIAAILALAAGILMLIYR
jgi:hypothetical protein